MIIFSSTPVHNIFSIFRNEFNVTKIGLLYHIAAIEKIGNLMSK